MDANGSTDEEIARLRAELKQARGAASQAERDAGVAKAELREIADQLAAAQLAQREWDELIGHVERERKVAEQVAAELAATRSSVTWRVGEAVLTPYRWVQRQRNENQWLARRRNR